MDECADPSVKDTMDGLKESVPIMGDEGRRTLIHTINDLVMVENVTPCVRDIAMEDDDGMTSMDVPSAAGTDGLTAGREDVTPSIDNTGVDTASLLEERIDPIVGEGVTDTVNVDIEELEVPEDVFHEKKKSKKRKHKSGADTREPSEPKKKLSKEERATKIARRAERKT
ncbi:hypothetical protein LIER_41535 [Lithospermum erythrorhizon]|uniref:Uncharacterized protein n=1 Tax=Lithospermum erythrorhizon TaxID=34254 RepID=A0AAV3RAT6_LITER